MRGTTSAHAENTSTAWIAGLTGWNYLRARGEYAFRKILRTIMVELPPRTRRIRIIGGTLKDSFGTTSAHAENTNPSVYLPRTGRNYLRARGEYNPLPLPSHSRVELPPRTRRIPNT